MKAKKVLKVMKSVLDETIAHLPSKVVLGAATKAIRDGLIESLSFRMGKLDDPFDYSYGSTHFEARYSFTLTNKDQPLENNLYLTVDVLKMQKLLITLQYYILDLQHTTKYKKLIKKEVSDSNIEPMKDTQNLYNQLKPIVRDLFKSSEIKKVLQDFYGDI